jgi:hypothetical protein
LDHSTGVITAGGVDWLSVNVEVLLREDGRGAIDDLARAVEGPTEDLFRDGGTEDITREFGGGVTVVNACRKGEGEREGGRERWGE